MEYILLSLSFILIIAGLLGSILPLLPGAPLSWFGLLLLYLTPSIEINYWILGFTLVLTLLIVLLDYVIPAQGTKRFGGSKYGIWGTNIGLVVGLIAPIPFGFILGPFVGALLGELLFDSKNIQRAFKAATGSFIGFLTSTFIQFVIGIIFLGIYLQIVIKHWDVFF
ncbi:DUF456 domain-containing protein [Flavobacterium sp. NKUCC04_CG]|uniref:DUF456 domain-containing protein n=1 Tax=Flavobacterium sp. NKUCC04_CG TaxID=2842121 RepID=UPI001C5B74F7|nr:DUF456 domain-containing protein [Flavobacterium sp. NKUCC04_CG]MBW3518973.1 DUF456 domain-containing protein [Flavobacterium sp. NKUCC04_CG]